MQPLKRKKGYARKTIKINVFSSMFVVLYHFSFLAFTLFLFFFVTYSVTLIFLLVI